MTRKAVIYSILDGIHIIRLIPARGRDKMNILTNHTRFSAFKTSKTKPVCVIGVRAFMEYNVKMILQRKDRIPL